MDTSRIRQTVRDKGASVALDLLVNVAIPYAIYAYAAPPLGDVRALLLSSLPPIGWSLVEFVRHRRLDAISLLAVAGILLSLLALAGGGGAKVLQLREKMVTGIIGLAFLGSALVRRPLILELAKAGMTRKGESEGAERLTRYAGDRLFRRSMTIMTMVWGFGLLADFAIGVVMVFTLTIKDYLIVNPVEGYVVLGGLSLWTFWYQARAKTRNAAIRAAEQHQR